MMKLKRNLIPFHQIPQTVLLYQAAITKFTVVKMIKDKVFLSQKTMSYGHLLNYLSYERIAQIQICQI